VEVAVVVELAAKTLVIEKAARAKATTVAITVPFNITDIFDIATSFPILLLAAHRTARPHIITWRLMIPVKMRKTRIRTLYCFFKI
jgi:hypothetical protein